MIRKKVWKYLIIPHKRIYLSNKSTMVLLAQESLILSMRRLRVKA